LKDGIDGREESKEGIDGRKESKEGIEGIEGRPRRDQQR
jgi:hypothetical protein